MSHPRDFSGKVVLVTGSTSGIGQEIVLQFAKYGAKVIVTGKEDYNVLNAVAEKCNDLSPARLQATVIRCDLTEDSQVYDLVDKITSIHGGFDILVNNAGVGSYAFIHDPKVIPQYDELMGINLRAPLLLTHLLIPHLIKTKGNIVNISSIVGIRPVVNSPIYCISKAALDMFTKTLSLDFGPKGVRINAVNPTVVNNTSFFDSFGMSKSQKEAFYTKCGKEFPMRRICTPEDIAKCVRFLASDDASFITGLIAPLDGGSVQTFCGVPPNAEARRMSKGWLDIADAE
jgi:NAD(P)-dependent dehydrogenase (short-subunit alcohol dehydrogenase family)